MRGYIDLFLGAGQGREHYTEEQLVVTLIDFFTGGSGTMSRIPLHCTAMEIDAIRTESH